MSLSVFIAFVIILTVGEHDDPTSYPESSGFLASSWSPRELSLQETKAGQRA